MLIMNHDQLQKTLHASQYAEQVLAQYAEQLQQDIDANVKTTPKKK